MNLQTLTDSFKRNKVAVAAVVAGALFVAFKFELEPTKLVKPTPAKPGLYYVTYAAGGSTTNGEPIPMAVMRTSLRLTDVENQSQLAKILAVEQFMNANAPTNHGKLSIVVLSIVPDSE